MLAQHHSLLIDASNYLLLCCPISWFSSQDPAHDAWFHRTIASPISDQYWWLETERITYQNRWNDNQGRPLVICSYQLVGSVTLLGGAIWDPYCDYWHSLTHALDFPNIKFCNNLVPGGLSTNHFVCQKPSIWSFFTEFSLEHEIQSNKLVVI